MRDLATWTRDFVLRGHRVLAIVLHLMLVAASNAIAFTLRFDADVPGWASIAFWQMLPWLVAIRGLSFFPFRLYEGLWRYTSIYDLKALIGAVAASSAVFSHIIPGPRRG